MKIINLIRERCCENEVWVDTFVAEDWVAEPENELREAVKEFLQTKEGLKSIKDTCGDYNWGDFMMDLPEEILKKHGLCMQYSELETTDIKVNQDEILCHDIHIPFSI